jgi:hypothetical protein
MTQTITLFMWAYQPYFRIGLRILAERTLELLAADLRPDVLLVGALAPDAGSDHPVCIEPEDEDWDVSVFACLEERIAFLDGAHPNHNIVYGDEPSNVELPARIRSASVRDAVLERVRGLDEARGTVSFVGSAVRVAKYEVVPVLLLDRKRVAEFPALTRTKLGQFSVNRSLLECAVAEILDEGRRELQVPVPAKSLSDSFRASPEELVRKAGRNFMWVPQFAGSPTPMGGLFDAMNLVASLRYEGAEGHGRVLIARPAHPAVRGYVTFETRVPLGEPRWARKVLEMASQDVGALCDGSSLFGLGSVLPGYSATGEDLFEVVFVGDQTWDLVHAGRTLMRTRYGLPGLPKPRLDQVAFDDTFSRLFERYAGRDGQAVWDAVLTACTQRHGTMIVVVEDAAPEAARLSRQGTPITAARLSSEVIKRVTAIDGALLLDPTGTCHAIGVILDGLATAEGTPARGARYNSALRYVATRKDAATLIVIVSEDGDVTMHPRLRPRVRRTDVAAVLERLRELVKQPTEKSIHSLRRELERFRFYLDAAACYEVNRAMPIFERVFNASQRIWLVKPSFEPDARMNDSYWAPETLLG